MAVAQDLRTVIEEVYCDLDRVVATLDLLTDGRDAVVKDSVSAALELLREKLWDSARRLEKVLEEAA